MKIANQQSAAATRRKTALCVAVVRTGMAPEAAWTSPSPKVPGQPQGAPSGLLTGRAPAPRRH